MPIDPSGPNGGRREARAKRAAARGVTKEKYKDKDFVSGPEVPFFRKVQPSTEYEYNSQYARWVEFHEEILGKDFNISPSDPLPNKELVKGWIRWLAKGGKGVIDELPTQNTIRQYWFRLQRAFHRRTNKEFSDSVRMEINEYISGNLAEDEEEADLYLSTEQKPKHIFQCSDLRVVLQYIWCRDEHIYSDERYRVEMALILQILTYSAARPGAVTESACHKGTNEVPLYKHFKLDMIISEQGPGHAELVLSMQMAYMKGMRGKDSSAKVAPFHEINLEFGLGMDPIILFLALAFADNAFADDLTPERLMEMLKKQTGGDRRLQWKSSVLDQPVFRQCRQGQDAPLSSTKGMTYGTFLREYRNMLWRSGFLIQASPYAIRRGAANTLNGKLTEPELRQVLGHVKASTFEKYYVSKAPFADTQSVALDLPQRRDLMSRLQGLGGYRDERAPKELPPEEKARIEEDPELSECTRKRVEMFVELQNNYGTIKHSPEDSKKEYSKLIQNQRYIRDRLVKLALEEYRKSWYTKMIQSPEGLRHDTRCTDSDTFSAYLNIPEHALSAQRIRVATAMFGHPTKIDSQAVLQDLIEICSSPKVPAARPRAAAEDTCDKPRNLSLKWKRTILSSLEQLNDGGNCPICGERVVDQPAGDQVAHVSSCVRISLKLALEKKHSQWFKDFRCLWGGCSARLNLKLLEVSDIIRHIQNHVVKSGSVCLWGRCNTRLQDSFALKAHLKRNHGVNTKATAFVGTNCDLCLEWFSCEFDWEEHCDLHIQDLKELECAPTSTRPGRCIFCLGNTDIPSSKRFKQFDSLFALRKHLKASHSNDKSIICPHPLCLRDFETEEALEGHIEQVHGIPKRESGLKRKKESGLEKNPKRVKR